MGGALATGLCTPGLCTPGRGVQYVTRLSASPLLPWPSTPPPHPQLSDVVINSKPAPSSPPPSELATTPSWSSIALVDDNAHPHHL